MLKWANSAITVLATSPLSDAFRAADLPNGSFVVPVDLFCLLSFVCLFVGHLPGCLFVDSKLVCEQDAESSYGSQNSDQQLRS